MQKHQNGFLNAGPRFRMFGNPNSQKRLKRRRRGARTGQTHVDRVRGRGRGVWVGASTSRAKFGREGAGTFQCPRPLYIGRNLTYPSRGTFQCLGSGPGRPPRHEHASRARPRSSHRSIFTLLRSFGSENFRELGPSARVRILGLRNHGVFTLTRRRRDPHRPRQRKMILTNCAACAAPLAHDAPRCVRCKIRYTHGRSSRTTVPRSTISAKP